MRLRVHESVGIENWKITVIVLLFVVSIAAALVMVVYLSTFAVANARYRDVRSLVALLTNLNDAVMEGDTVKIRRIELIQDFVAGNIYRYCVEVGTDDKEVESVERVVELVQSAAKELRDEADQLRAVVRAIEGLGMHLPLVVRAIRGESIADSELPELVSVPSFRMIMLIGWIVGSVLAWVVLCWLFGFACGYHPWSMLAWISNDPIGTVVCLIFCYVLPLPGTIVNGILMGLFYGCWGLVLLCRRNNEVEVEGAADTNDQDSSAEADPGQGMSEQELAELFAGIRDDRSGWFDDFVEQTKAVHARYVSAARNGLKQEARKLERVQLSVGLARAKLVQLERNDDIPLLAESALTHLESHPCVRGFQVQDTRLFIYPGTLFIESGGRRYEIGDYAIVCDFTQGDVWIECLRSTSSKYIHPYCNGDYVCVGVTAEKELKRFFRQGSLYSVVDLAVEMISRPTQDMSAWKEVTHVA